MQGSEAARVREEGITVERRGPCFCASSLPAPRRSSRFAGCFLCACSAVLEYMELSSFGNINTSACYCCCPKPRSVPRTIV